MRFRHQREFGDHATSACIATDHTLIEAIFMTDDDGEGLLCMEVPIGTEPTEVDKFFTGRHEYAAMATVVAWAPNAATPTAPCWLLVTVAHGRAGVFTVGRIAERKWYELSTAGIPWFAASTAGSLRKALGGEPMGPFKRAGDGDARLFGSVMAGQAPPADKHGRI